MRLTKTQVVQMVRELIQESDYDFRGDTDAKVQLWHDYTDSLCKDGQITEHQYNTWSCPF